MSHAVSILKVSRDVEAGVLWTRLHTDLAIQNLTILHMSM